MKLQFPTNKIDYWAEKYDYSLPDTDLDRLVPQVMNCGFLTLDQLRILARWKSPRNSGRIDSNDDEYVKAITNFALQTGNSKQKKSV